MTGSYQTDISADSWFSGSSACNYVPGFAAAAGALNDAYFISRNSKLDRRVELWQSQKTDLINGLLDVASFEEVSLAAKCEVLLDGIRAYMAPTSVRKDIAELVLAPGALGSDFLRHVKRIAAGAQ